MKSKGTTHVTYEVSCNPGDTFVGCSLSGKIPYILSSCEKLPTNQFSPYQL